MPNKTITQVPVQTKDFTTFEVHTDEETGAMSVRGRYQPKDSTGLPIGATHEAQGIPTQGQRQAIEAIIAAVLVPVANSQEGT